MENNTRKKLFVSPSPHIFSATDTTVVMRDVLIALVPALLMAIYVFGIRALILTAVCAVSCVVFEYLFEKVTKKDSTIGDLSAVVTGVLIAYNLPSGFPFWMAIIGCFFGIVVVKQLFGGLGQNFANPAITARIFLFVSFTTQMATWPLPKSQVTADAVTGPTPLGILAEGNGELPSNTDMFLGTIGGCLGEVSALALIIGGVYLVIRKVISPATPIAFIATVAVFALLIGQDPIFHICAGGVMLGAIFMATDYVTSPMMPLGKVIFGIGCGIITMLIRIYGDYPEGVSFSILLMNILTPHIDNFCINRLYGKAEK